MSVLEIIYLTISIISAFMSIGVGLYLFSKPNSPGIRPLAISMVLITFWIVVQLFSLPHINDQWLFLLINLRFFPLAFVPYIWFLFSLQFYLQTTRLSRKLVIALGIIPTFTQIMVWTNPLHHLFIQDFKTGFFRSFYIVTEWHWGWGFWLHTVYSYGILAIGIILIIHAAANLLQLYRGQAILIIIGVSVPILITVFHTFEIIPIYLDLTPIAFTFTGITLFLNITKFHFSSVLPVGKEKLLEYLSDGMIMINHHHEILDINETALVFFHTSHIKTLGKKILDVFPFMQIPDIHEREIYEIEPMIGKEIKRFEIISSPIEKQGMLSGWIIIIRDITEIVMVEMAYKDIERRFNKVIMHAHEGIVIVDETGKIIIWNQAIEKMLNTKRSEMVGKFVWDIIPYFTFRHNIPYENLLIIEEELRKGLTTGKSTFFDIPIEICLQTKEKSEQFVEFMIYSIKAGRGYFICFSCHDITEQIAARVILQEANLTLELEVKERTADLENLMNTLEQRIQDRTKDLSILYQISAAANQISNLEEMLKSLLHMILEALNATSGTIHIYDQQEDILNLIAHENFSPVFLLSIQKLPARRNIFGRVIQEESTIISPDLSFENCKYLVYPRTENDEPFTYTGNLMKTKGKNIGVLSVFKPSSEHFSVEQIALLTTISEQLGVLIENHQLQQKEEQIAIINERQRLARDLHDSVNQRLYSLMLYSAAGKKAYQNDNDAKVKIHLDKIEQNAQLALREMRLLIHQLRPDTLENQGFIGAITHRLDFVEKRAGVDYEFNIQGDLDLSKQEEVELFTIITESLNNALKHANASKIMINITSTEDYFRLEICDNGIGFDSNLASKRNGLGIISMRERAEIIGGTLSIQSESNNYTCVIVEIGQKTMQSHTVEI